MKNAEQSELKTLTPMSNIIYPEAPTRIIDYHSARMKDIATLRDDYHPEVKIALSVKTITVDRPPMKEWFEMIRSITNNY